MSTRRHDAIDIADVEIFPAVLENNKCPGISSDADITHANVTIRCHLHVDNRIRLIDDSGGDPAKRDLENRGRTGEQIHALKRDQSANLTTARHQPGDRAAASVGPGISLGDRGAAVRGDDDSTTAGVGRSYRHDSKQVGVRRNRCLGTGEEDLDNLRSVSPER